MAFQHEPCSTRKPTTQVSVVSRRNSILLKLTRNPLFDTTATAMSQPFFFASATAAAAAAWAYSRLTPGVP